MRVLVRTLAMVLAAAGGVALVSALMGQAPESLSWYVARSSGLVAVTLLTVTVLAGLSTALRVPIPGLGKKDTLALHRGSSVLAFGFLIVHMSALLADSYVHFSVANLVGVELASYRPLAVLAGSLAAGLMLLAATAFAWRRLLGPSRWRWLHRSGYGAWALGLVHAVAAGTDSGVPAVQWVYLISVVAVVGLLAVRLTRTRVVSRLTARV